MMDKLPDEVQFRKAQRGLAEGGGSSQQDDRSSGELESSDCTSPVEARATNSNLKEDMDTVLREMVKDPFQVRQEIGQIP